MELFHFDFTRARSPWAFRNPYVEMLESPFSMLPSFIPAPPAPYWHKTRVGEYLPPVSSGSQLQNVLRQVRLATPTKVKHECDIFREQRKTPPKSIGGEVVRSTCMVVANLKKKGGVLHRLRNFVGWKIKLPDHIFGFSHDAFVDSNLVIIVGFVLALWVLEWTLRCMFWIIRWFVLATSRVRAEKPKKE
eukprot:c21505_g1_i1.p1 GENE.c21505_g1_i1~~c21505_g1_i1.p1  ORF type:complete len:190 (-),score=38.44 c21505_g1_i1:58-627(-)